MVYNIYTTKTDCCRDLGAPEQIIVVQRLDLPPPEDRVRASQYLDVMEVLVLFCCCFVVHQSCVFVVSIVLVHPIYSLHTCNLSLQAMHT